MKPSAVGHSNGFIDAGGIIGIVVAARGGIRLPAQLPKPARQVREQ